jgi:acetylornithine deacetylase
VTTRREVEQLLSDLLAIDSVNPDLVAGGAGEGAIAGCAAGWLRDRDLEVTLQLVADGRANVVARAFGSGGGKSLMLNAHLDSVGVVGNGRSLHRTHRWVPHVRARRLRHEGRARSTTSADRHLP